MSEGPKPKRVAIVAVHGMGDQRPGDAALPFAGLLIGPEDEWQWRQTEIGRSLEGRYATLAGTPNLNPVDVYEYHWSYHMKDNRLRDLGGVAYRLLIPTSGLKHRIAVSIALILALYLSIAGRGIVSWIALPTIPGLQWLGMSPLESLGARPRLPQLALLATLFAVSFALTAIRAGADRSKATAVGVWTAFGSLVVMCIRPTTSYDLVALGLIVIAAGTMLRLLPLGLRPLVGLAWLAAGVVMVTLVFPYWETLTATAASDTSRNLLVLLFGGVGAVAFGQLIGRIAPWITASFVDVVRYLDTSPRSYEARRKVREGLVKVLGDLHDLPVAQQYDRIIVAGHSLGSLIAYDALSTLWFRRTKEAATSLRALVWPSTLDTWKDTTPEEFQRRQCRNYLKVARIRTSSGNRVWRVTDFVSFGSPMTFTHMLASGSFLTKQARREVMTCPPPPEAVITGFPSLTPMTVPGRSPEEVETAVFAVVRWTNLWYPPSLALLGDSVAGPLAPLFGPGINDKEIRDDWKSHVPVWAHSKYTNRKGRRPGGFAESIKKIIRNEPL